MNKYTVYWLEDKEQITPSSKSFKESQREKAFSFQKELLFKHYFHVWVTEMVIEKYNLFHLSNEEALDYLLKGHFIFSDDANRKEELLAFVKNQGYDWSVTSDWTMPTSYIICIED